MARLLESLRPLAGLLAQNADPAGACQHLIDLAAGGAPGPRLVAVCADLVEDRPLVRPVLIHAGVLESSGALSSQALVRLAQTLVLLEVSQAGSWHLVLTVPGFLRNALDAFIAAHGQADRPRETASAVREVAGAAVAAPGGRLLVAAPFLQAQFVQVLVADVERVVAGGGRVQVITRALGYGTRGRSDANVDAVAMLRAAAERAQPGAAELTGRRGVLEVFSWEEVGLGVHFKVVLADGVPPGVGSVPSDGAAGAQLLPVAYLGSANLTGAGVAAHAEAGVLVRGEGVEVLSGWLDEVCAELARRRLPHG